MHPGDVLRVAMRPSSNEIDRTRVAALRQVIAHNQAGAISSAHAFAYPAGVPASIRDVGSENPNPGIVGTTR